MITNLQQELRTLKNSAKAKVLAGFFKTGKGQYGEGDKFLGIAVPQIRSVIKNYQSLPLVEIEKILQSEFHEERLAAVFILVFQFQNGSERVRENIFNFYLRNTAKINSWDLVDMSSHQIIGGYLQDRPKNILFKLAESEMLWERRIAMVSTFFEIKNGQSEITLAIAEKLLYDKEDLMHKAVGWMLREVGKRCSEKEEEVFLQKYAVIMSRTMLRYAIERFAEDKRQYYLTNSKI